MKRLWSATVLVLSAYSVLLAQTYPIVWTNPIKTNVNADNSLTKTGKVLTSDSGIASQNILASGSDGYLQFTYPGPSTSGYMVSLSRLNNDPSYSSSDYSIYVNQSTLYIFLTTFNQGNFGPLTANDVLKVSREGNAINFYKNGVVLKTVALASNTDFLRADVSIATGSVPVVTASFRPTLVLKPQFAFPSLTNNDGGISLQLEGQYNPVTYSWISGETAAAVNGKSHANAYTVTATDAQGRSVTRSYGLGYPVAWTNLSNVSVNADNTLTKTGTAVAGASSLNVLAANTDGWVEFVANEPAANYLIGLSRIDRDVSAIIDYCWYVNYTGSILIYENGGSKGVVSTLVKGDVFRIAREGTNINYYLNGALKRTVAVPANQSFVVDVVVGDTYGPTPVVTTSFDKQIRVLPSITLPTGSNASGSIAITVQGDYSPSTINWSSSETTNLITNKSRGKYTLTVTDAASRTFTRSYQLGYPVSWTDLQNAALTMNNEVYTTSGANLWNSAAVSSNILPPSTDGWIEFSLPRPTSIVMIGLARTNAVAGYTSIEYAFYFKGGDVIIYESGASRGTLATQMEGDVFTIAREGLSIKYYINGVVVRTIATNPSYQLIVDSSINNGSLSVVTTSFSRTPQTYYARANGTWTTPSTWSLTEGGAACAQYPGNEDTAVVKGYAVTVSSGIYAAGVNIIANNDATSVTVDGANTNLTVKGNVTLRGENNAATDKALVVQNKASISVQP